MRHHCLYLLLMLTAASAAFAADSGNPPAPTAPQPAAPSTDPAGQKDSAGLRDPAAFLGLTPRDAFAAFGAPLRLQTVRGPEAWQDDVVFVYDTMDLYWFKDRVWQIGLKSAYGVRIGDSQDQVRAVFGEPLNRLDSAFIYQRTGRSWPLRLRVGFDAALKVSDLYLYRADY